MIKGKAVNVVAELQQQRWEDQDGKKKDKILLHVTNVSFTSGSKDSNGSGDRTQNTPQTAQKQATQSAPAKSNPFQQALAGEQAQGAPGDFSNPSEYDDDVPF